MVKSIKQFLYRVRTRKDFLSSKVGRHVKYSFKLQVMPKGWRWVRCGQSVEYTEGIATPWLPFVCEWHIGMSFSFIFPQCHP